MTIYEASTSRDVATLVARREDWQAVLAGIPEQPQSRAPDQWIRMLIGRALQAEGDMVRVTMTPDEARWVLALTY